MWRKELPRKLAGMLAAILVLTSLQIVPVEKVYAEEKPGRIVSSNVLSDYNTSFEGVNESGNLYWWNDASWGQTNIPRKEYGESAKPDAGCGDYYVQVNPAAEGEKAQCQIAGDGVAALIKGGKTYEYSYYAKLAEGETEGAVTLNVIGDWSTSAVVTPDKEVTLNADKWQKVTGTFTLASDATQVAVRFEGTADVSFCLDDLRVAEVVEEQEEEPGRIVSSNVLSDYNTSFEGVNESGNLYWWNDASWGQTNI
ncbi:MAG: carbohydrate binding domain-containing protein, partial [Acetatifactor sp.]|nr:carbohydrate binding domain-containing protein [Acetatifactor sp.]